MNPLVSIVINNCNYARYIRQAIESALAQTYKNVELIIVDDGSTDESRVLINEYIDRSQVLLKENGGQASAFNIGITEAKGDFILLLDSDDYLYPEAVEVCVKAFPEGYSRVFYRLAYVDENDNPIIGRKGKDNFRMFDGDVFTTLAERGIFPATPTSGNFFDATKLKMTLPIPEKEYRICADLFLFAGTAFWGPVRSIDKKLAAYRIHGKNNFCPVAKAFDEKTLKNQLHNLYQSTKLLEEACKKAGFDYKYRIFERSFDALLTLCTGYKIELDSPYVSVLTRFALLRLLIRYLRFGTLHVAKRITQFAYLSLVILLPGIYARQMLKLLHAWIRR
jgi:glycosyltransferase involved in cell wall biosynthesis